MSYSPTWFQAGFPRPQDNELLKALKEREARERKFKEWADVQAWFCAPYSCVLGEITTVTLQ